MRKVYNYQVKCKKSPGKGRPAAKIEEIATPQEPPIEVRSIYNASEFPTLAACSELRWRPGRVKSVPKPGMLFPRVQVETPAPPVFGKETLADLLPCPGFLSIYVRIFIRRFVAVSR
jgi:hypothetical protein